MIGVFAYDDDLKTWKHVFFSADLNMMVLYLINKKDDIDKKQVEEFIKKQSAQVEDKEDLNQSLHLSAIDISAPSKKKDPHWHLSKRYKQLATPAIVYGRVLDVSMCPMAYKELREKHSNFELNIRNVVVEIVNVSIY